MTTRTLTLAALAATAVLALGAPVAYASQGPDDGPGHDRGDDHGRHHTRGAHQTDDHTDEHTDDHTDDRGGRHGRGQRVVASGTCTGGARWSLEAEPDDGGLEVEAEIDAAGGQSWQWRLADNGTAVAQGSAVTSTRSGSFDVERQVADLTGRDTITLIATSGAQRCAGSVTL